MRKFNFQSYAILALLVLWVSTSCSIALMEIAFVCALVFWLLSKRQDAQHQHPVFNLAAPRSNTGCCEGIDWTFWAPFAIFFLLVLLSFFTSEYPKQSFRGILKIVKPLLVFLMTADLFHNKENLKRFDLAFLITFLVVMIDSSIQYAFGKDLLRGFAAEHSSAGLRLVGPFGNFAKMATYLVLVIPVFIMRFWSDFGQSGQRKKSFYALVLSAAGFTLLYLTRCRGPVLALVLSFFLFFAYKRWFKTLGIMLLLFFLILAVAPRGMIIHLDAEKKEQSIVERFELWKRALDVIAAKPWTGTGINTYNVAHEKYDTLKQKKYMPVSGASGIIKQNTNGSVSFTAQGHVWTSDNEQKIICIAGQRYNIYKDPAGRYYIWNDIIARGYYAHNGYLQLAAEIGLPGVFCFLWFLVMYFRRALQAIKRVRGSPEEFIQLGLLASLLAFLIYAAADNNLQSPPSLMMFWYLAGVLMARQMKPISEESI